MRTSFLLGRLAVGACALTMAVAAHAQTPFAKEPFKDVAKTSVHFEAIDYLRQQNVLKGYLDGTFRPTRNITRAEFVAIMTNPFFLTGARSNDCLAQHYGVNARGVFFPDVKRDSEAAQDVCEAVTRGFVRGYPDGNFRPNYQISFVEAAKVAATILVLETDEAPHTDAKWYEPYVRRLAELNAIPTSILRFDQKITRGEMAEIVYRLKTGNNDKAGASYESLR